MTAEAAPGRTPARLRVEDLEVCLATEADVVSEISFEVAPGEVLGLVGESGSGKTTVALALLGHVRRGLRMTKGRVLVDGLVVTEMSPAELRAFRGARASYVAQEPAAALNPVLRVGTQVREALWAHRGQVAEADEGDARVSAVLEEVDLPSDRSFLRRYPHQLSGGQQQRIALAMAFACRPSLIVLDEPTTGLDVTTQRHVLETVRQLAAGYQVAAVYVSHDLAVVRQVATRAAVMYAGRVVEIGPVSDVFHTPAHPYTVLLMRAVPSLERTEVLEGIAGQPPSPGRRPQGCSFAPRCPLAASECFAAAPAEVSISPGHSLRCVRAEAAVPRAAGSLTPDLFKPEAHAPLLAVEHLSASYGQNEVLHDVSFVVPPQTCVGVVGESGSGKTTLSRCIVGLHRNWRGSVTFDGTTLPLTARQRDVTTLKRVQYIFQDPYTALNPRKTVGQLVAQPIEHFFDLSHDAVRDRVVAALGEVALGPGFLNRYPDELSGGERQRVAIARALASQPDLLVCDEVSSALDVSVQATIIELLRSLQQQRHLSMIFVTHNLALVRGIAQLVVVLSKGRVVDAGTVSGTLEHPSASYTARLMSDAPRLAAPVG